MLGITYDTHPVEMLPVGNCTSPTSYKYCLCLAQTHLKKKQKTKNNNPRQPSLCVDGCQHTVRAGDEQ